MYAYEVPFISRGGLTPPNTYTLTIHSFHNAVLLLHWHCPHSSCEVLHDCKQGPAPGTNTEQIQPQAQPQRVPARLRILSGCHLCCVGLQRYPVPPRAPLVSLAATGKEMDHVGLVQPGHLVRLKEFTGNWMRGGFGPLLQNRELKYKSSKAI